MLREPRYTQRRRSRRAQACGLQSPVAKAHGPGAIIHAVRHRLPGGSAAFGGAAAQMASIDGIATGKRLGVWL